MSLANIGRYRSNYPRPDTLIANRQKEEEERSVMIECTNYYAKANIKSEFERSTSNMIFRNEIRHKAAEFKQDAQKKLDQRRAKLKELLSQELQQYQTEIESKLETRDSILEKLKKKAVESREKREKDRVQIVEQKLLQKWRSDCDELRRMKSKALEIKVFQGRVEQVKEKEQVAQILNKEKKYYDDLWEQDRMKKVARAQKDLHDKHERDQKTFQELNKQLDQIRLHREEEKKLKEENSRLVIQQIKLNELEAERAVQEKERVALARRMELDYFNRLHLEEKAKELQRALDLDKAVIMEVSAQEESERLESHNRKIALRNEALQYQKYLKDQRELERQREHELDNLRKIEDQQVWNKKKAILEKEQNARDKLMQEVITTRQSQISEKLSAIEDRRKAMECERIQLLKEIEGLKEEKVKKYEQRIKNQVEYSSDLKEQIAFQKEMKQLEQASNQLEIEMAKEAEEQYQSLLKREISKATGH